MQKLTYFSDKTLITAGEFARISQSTKRTVSWYTQKGLLTPKDINDKGYRFYTAEQIIDFQVIQILRKLNFSLEEIKKLLDQDSSARELFELKKQLLTDEVKRLQKNIKDIGTYYSNLATEGVLIKPVTKTVKAFEMYYLDKVGPYAKIYDYCEELKSYFSKIPKNATYLTLFPGTQYLPKKDKFKIGVVVTREMKLKKNVSNIIGKETIPAFKSLSYKHIGSTALISMIIEQAHQYRMKHKIKLNSKIGIHELEFYIRTGLNGFNDPDREVSEINIPII